MVKKILLILLAGGIIIGGMYFFTSVKTSEVQGYEIINPYFLDWQQVTSAIPWSPRDSHALAVFKDKMWLMGGLNANGFVIEKEKVDYWKAPHFSDVWASENGKDWNLVTKNSPWGERRSMQVIVFKNKMWLMGGWGPDIGYQNDVWSSEDGINWQLAAASAAWPAREGHQTIVFKDKIWLIGGVDYAKRETKSDVWYSEDGINWHEATPNAQWSSRWDHAVTVYKDKLWLIGGMDLNDGIFQDVWSSEDGTNWTLITDNPPWQKRQGHNVLAFQNKLWVIGRLDDETNSGTNDVWFSEDGINWTKTKNNPAWLGREDSAAVVFKDRIWLTGGMDQNWTWRNDVWHSVFTTDLAPTQDTLIYPSQALIPFWQQHLASISSFLKFGAEKKITVDLSQQKMRLFEDRKLIKEFAISSGAVNTPTPAGDFRIFNKHYLVFSRLSNCWLPYWMGFTADGLYGLHLLPICREGWRGQGQLGEPASSGCVRSGFEDAKTLYNWVKVGTPITIYGQTPI